MTVFSPMLTKQRKRGIEIAGCGKQQMAETEKISGNPMIAECGFQKSTWVCAQIRMLTIKRNLINPSNKQDSFPIGCAVLFSVILLSPPPPPHPKLGLQGVAGVWKQICSLPLTKQVIGLGVVVEAAATFNLLGCTYIL